MNTCEMQGRNHNRKNRKVKGNLGLYIMLTFLTRKCIYVLVIQLKVKGKILNLIRNQRNEHFNDTLMYKSSGQNFKDWQRLWLSLGSPDGSNGKESACNTGDPGSIPGSGRSSRKRNGCPLQYSCLENSMDRGAWRATVHGVTKSWTQLSD